MAGRRRLPLSAALIVAACHGPSQGPSPSASPSPSLNSTPIPSSNPSLRPSPSAPSAAPASTLAPLSAGKGIVPLAVPGFGDAVVSLPLGATEPQPIALALHGNFDRPEWQCEVWRGITEGKLFVLCPRGIPRRDVPKDYDRWEWSSLAKTKAEVLAALGALRERYPDHIKSGPIIFTGFSLGAILGARMIQDPELNVAAAVLTEGGYQGWTLARAKALQPTLKHVLFACGQTECQNAFKYQLEPLFKRAELPATLVAEVKTGHTYDGPVAAGIQKEWPVLVATVKPD